METIISIIYYLLTIFIIFFIIDNRQSLMEFLKDAETKFANMRPLGSDIETVKEQIEQLKAFKAEVDPQMVKVEALNR